MFSCRREPSDEDVDVCDEDPSLFGFDGSLEIFASPRYRPGHMQIRLVHQSAWIASAASLIVRPGDFSPGHRDLRPISAIRRADQYGMRFI